MTRYRKHEINTAGRDFVVGDIHGHFNALDRLLELTRFNPEQDRLFSVGDLVDRGPQSDRALEFLAKPWFHAVRGNHEDLIIQAHKHGGDTKLSIANGGAWAAAMHWAEAREYAEAFDQLPYAAEVWTPLGRFGLVHAECPHASWDDFRDALLQERPATNVHDLKMLESCALWSRSRAHSQDLTPVMGISNVLVGHTPVQDVAQLGNVIYLDTGACYGGRLTLLCLMDIKLHSIAVQA